MVFHFDEGYGPDQGGQVVQLLARGDCAFQWIMGAQMGEYMAFELVNGANAAEAANPTSTRRKPVLKKGVAHTSVVEVRNGGVRAFLDGALAADLKTDYANLRPVRTWLMPGPPCLGVGSHKTPLVIEQLDVVEVSGPGTIVPPASP